MIDYARAIRKPKPRRKRQFPKFFRDLDVVAQRMIESGFFTKLDRLIAKEQKAQEFAIRLQRRIERNKRRADAVLSRIRQVESIDLFKATKHIGPNFFGEKTLQFEAVKVLHQKRDRILWYLRGLYTYLITGTQVNGWAKHRGLNNYSKHRTHYYALLELHKDRLRQEKWDKKRAKVRERRRKQALSRGEEVAEMVELKHKLKIKAKVPVTQDVIGTQELDTGNTLPLLLREVSFEETPWD